MTRRVFRLLLLSLLFTACTLIQDVEEIASYPEDAGPLAPTFAVVTWNVAKGEKSSAAEVTGLIQSLSERLPSPVIALQEATEEMLRLPNRGAHFAESFRWWGSKTRSGVALLARTAPLATQAIRVKRRELGCTTPKMGLAATYPATGQDGSTHRILVITLHGLNFELAPQGLSAQMAIVHRLVSEFHGPAVVCGDFNTWSNRRLAVVTQALAGFTEAPVTEGRTGTSWLVALIGGNTELAMDRIFYRGLRLNGPARAFPSALSDHVPVIARFTLP